MVGPNQQKLKRVAEAATRLEYAPGLGAAGGSTGVAFGIGSMAMRGGDGGPIDGAARALDSIASRLPRAVEVKEGWKGQAPEAALSAAQKDSAEYRRASRDIRSMLSSLAEARDAMMAAKREYDDISSQEVSPAAKAALMAGGAVLVPGFGFLAGMWGADKLDSELEKDKERRAGKALRRLSTDMRGATKKIVEANPIPSVRKAGSASSQPPSSGRIDGGGTGSDGPGDSFGGAGAGASAPDVPVWEPPDSGDFGSGGHGGGSDGGQTRFPTDPPRTRDPLIDDPASWKPGDRLPSDWTPDDPSKGGFVPDKDWYPGKPLPPVSEWTADGGVSGSTALGGMGKLGAGIGAGGAAAGLGAVGAKMATSGSGIGGSFLGAGGTLGAGGGQAGAAMGAGAGSSGGSAGAAGGAAGRPGGMSPGMMGGGGRGGDSKKSQAGTAHLTAPKLEDDDPLANRGRTQEGAAAGSRDALTSEALVDDIDDEL